MAKSKSMLKISILIMITISFLIFIWISPVGGLIENEFRLRKAISLARDKPLRLIDSCSFIIADSSSKETTTTVEVKLSDYPSIIRKLDPSSVLIRPTREGPYVYIVLNAGFRNSALIITENQSVMKAARTRNSRLLHPCIAYVDH